MSFASLNFRISAGINDYKRDKAIPLPEGITCCRNISYGTHGNANLLDVYYPDGTNCPLPTIVSSTVVAMSMAARKSIVATAWIWQNGDSPL